jgi:hypothetical protein
MMHGQTNIKLWKIDFINMKFELFTEVTVEIIGFLDVTPCCPVHA